MARVSFNLFSYIYYFFHLFFFFIKFFEFWHYFNCSVYCHWKSLRTNRYKSCNSISHIIWMSESASYIANRTARSHCSECSYLRDFISAIFIFCVLYHFITFIIGKIHINIGSGWAFWIEKSLKRYFIFKRINICNTGKICDHRAGNRTPDCRQDIIFMSEIQDVFYNKKIRSVTLVFDYF